MMNKDTCCDDSVVTSFVASPWHGPRISESGEGKRQLPIETTIMILQATELEKPINITIIESQWVYEHILLNQNVFPIEPQVDTRTSP